MANYRNKLMCIASRVRKDAAEQAQIAVLMNEESDHIKYVAENGTEEDCEFYCNDLLAECPFLEDAEVSEALN